MQLLTRNALRLLHRIGRGVLPGSLFAHSYEEIPGRVHVEDLMLRSTSSRHVRHYLTSAQSALANLQGSLAAAGRSFTDVSDCLDFGCGRVTRHLVRGLSPSAVTACDVDRRAVAFCATEFGCKPLVLRQDPKRWLLPERYDLIWVGSVLTHLPEDQCNDLLDLLVLVLRRDGLLVFSSQSESCLDNLGWYGEHFRQRERAFREGLQRAGMHFVPYPGKPYYGITIHTEGHLRLVMAERYRDRLRLVRYAPRGWDDHQDVWSFQAPS